MASKDKDETAETTPEREVTETTQAGYSGVMEKDYPQGVGQPLGTREGQIDTSTKEGRELKKRLDAQHAVGATDLGGEDDGA